ncbi:hypothetical protein ACJELQ_26930, partial [Escherichia coli]
KAYVQENAQEILQYNRKAGSNKGCAREKRKHWEVRDENPHNGCEKGRIQEGVRASGQNSESQDRSGCSSQSLAQGCIETV